MKHQYQFGNADASVLGESAQIRALISDLANVVRLIDSDIATEEELAKVSDPFDANYPILARSLTARRDNLRETIAVLENRLSSPVRLTG